MSLIYTPKGKAREYSPLALNVYSGGCDHGCKYCYCSGMQKAFGREWSRNPVPRNLRGLEREAQKADRQILLCFVGDPYCKAEAEHRVTREALALLESASCSVAILTKGGTRCLDDIEMFTSWPGTRIKVGATLTFRTNQKSQDWEPGAAIPDNRLESLSVLHKAGVKTWASIEPVIDPVESLAIIKASLPYVDAYKVGRWNHDNRSNVIDWNKFGMLAVSMIRSAGKALYVKVDLQPHFPAEYLTDAEKNIDTLALPDKPK